MLPKGEIVRLFWWVIIVFVALGMWKSVVIALAA